MIQTNERLFALQRAGSNLSRPQIGFSLGLFGLTLIETDPVTDGRVATVAISGTPREIHLVSVPIARCAVVRGESSSEEIAEIFFQMLVDGDVFSMFSNPGEY